MNQKKLNQAVFSLHRYFIWANRMRTHLDEKLPILVEQLKTKTDPKSWTNEAIEVFLYLSYWYGGLYVVIEGWKQLKLKAGAVDALLASEANVSLLKRYRNGVFSLPERLFRRPLYWFHEGGGAGGQMGQKS